MVRIAPRRPYYPNLDPILDALAQASYWQRRLFLKNQRYPRFLYKYRALALSNVDSVKHMRDIIVESTFWLSSPFDFNDPFDMSAKLIVEGSAARKKRRFKDLVAMHSAAGTRAGRRRMTATLTKQPDAKVLQQLQVAHESTLRATGVCAFAEDPRSILMWSHYSANHTGVCLQFEIAKDSSTLMQALNVEYAKKYPVINWLEETAEDLKTSLLRKHVGWQYEGEHRIVMPNGAHCYLPFQSEALTGVILGCRAPGPTKSKIKELLAERAALKLSVPALYVARKHPSRYALVLTRC